MRHTTQGVRRWPLKTFKHFPVWQSIILTVWSPLRKQIELVGTSFNFSLLFSESISLLRGCKCFPIWTESSCNSWPRRGQKRAILGRPTMQGLWFCPVHNKSGDVNYSHMLLNSQYMLFLNCSCNENKLSLPRINILFSICICKS